MWTDDSELTLQVNYAGFFSFNQIPMRKFDPLLDGQEPIAYAPQMKNQDNASTGVIDDSSPEIPANILTDNWYLFLSQYFSGDRDVSPANGVWPLSITDDIATAKHLGHKTFLGTAPAQHDLNQLFNGDIPELGRGKSITVPEGEHVMIDTPHIHGAIPKADCHARTNHSGD
jgi:hypothetical protein